MNNNLVAYSRAGDIFHYRWAARRCIKMVYPNSLVDEIVIEGSKDNEKSGEYSIDVTEYLHSKDKKKYFIDYYQLKHTTTRTEIPFLLSDLKKTIRDFSERYKQSTSSLKTIKYYILTNRPISQNLKDNISNFIIDKKTNKVFNDTIKKYTNLQGSNLKRFLSALILIDNETNFEGQREELKREISLFLVNNVNDQTIDGIVSLVQSKVLPNNNNTVNREEILKKFGVSSERDIFPAPFEATELIDIIDRKQYNQIQNDIINYDNPVIIHANGGVGKSIFCQHVKKHLPMGSVGIVYDCFGGGTYRNKSRSRHNHRQAYVQIANELSSQGLCAPLLYDSAVTDTKISMRFIDRIETAIKSIQDINKNNTLVILIDAADNAIMAAHDNNESCFINDLLNENIPTGCRLVLLCRSGRIDLLKATFDTKKIELKPFDEKETFINLKTKFPNATYAQGLEFHRLTNNGNPRNQSYILGSEFESIDKALESIGPVGTSIDYQLDMQLDRAIDNIKNHLSKDYQKKIDAICIGLANLPPFIPIAVLSAVAKVMIADVKSFVNDFGQHIYLIDDSIQFRDKTTETWFRNKYSGNVETINTLINALLPLTKKYIYVAETLPMLFLEGERYEELIEISMSDTYLPENKVDARSIKIYRLKFACKAALKLNKYPDAIKIAMLAGEEVAGDERQQNIFINNIDIIPKILDKQKIQELAYKRKFKGEWLGSENIYSAVLLSHFEDYKGEAQGYLRSAENWLKNYFKDIENQQYPSHRVTDEDIIAFTWTYFNLYGIQQSVEYLLSWDPPITTYKLTRLFVKMMIDNEYYSEIEILLNTKPHDSFEKYQYLIIAATHELISIGRFPNKSTLSECLNLLYDKKRRISKIFFSRENIDLSIVIFLEACLKNNLSKMKILNVLKRYGTIKINSRIVDEYFSKDRMIFFHSLALKNIIEGNIDFNIEDLFDKSEKHISQEREINNTIKILLPFWEIRINTLLNNNFDYFNSIERAELNFNKIIKESYYEISFLFREKHKIISNIITLGKNSDEKLILELFNRYFRDESHLDIRDIIYATRNSNRVPHLSIIGNNFEQQAHNLIQDTHRATPEDYARWYVDLARAVQTKDIKDSIVYFDFGLDKISKFGDELVSRWEAIVSIADQSSNCNNINNKIAYDFLRCAELVGENVLEEKYWDRNNAIITAARLSPALALTTLSRWRDRDIGSFEKQIYALTLELINLGYITPTIGWSLSSFVHKDFLVNLATSCIEKEQDREIRNYIFCNMVQSYSTSITSSDIWTEVKQLAIKYAFESEHLDSYSSYFNYLSLGNLQENENHIELKTNKDKQDLIDWGEVFSEMTLFSKSGLCKAIQNYFKIKNNRYLDQEFMKALIDRIKPEKAIELFESLLEIQDINLSDFNNIFKIMPLSWFSKRSVINWWPNYIRNLACQHAIELTGIKSIEHYFRNLPSELNDISNIKTGILKGLANHSDLISAETFFGLVEIAVIQIKPEDALDILSWTLKRFKKYYTPNYGDGKWSDWLEPLNDSCTNVAGLIASALGSPRSIIRWEAVHAIMCLSETGDISTIDKIINWKDIEKLTSFNCKDFPFYEFHVELYLLIALNRISISNLKILLPFSDTFSNYTFIETPHILIQYFSTQIALEIEKYFPKTYKQSTIEEFNSIIKTLTSNQIDKSKMINNDTSDLQGDFDEKNKFIYVWDIERYWFNSLGDIFGISETTISNMATMVIRKEWGIDNDGSYEHDPRVELWRQTSYERETWHDHSSYPKTDKYNFYLSYHAMFVVAAKLINKAPLVLNQYLEENSWQNWVNRHLLTRSDKYLLADSRNSFPIKYYSFDKASKEFLQEVNLKKYINIISETKNSMQYLNVFGNIENKSYDSSETIYISSALVSNSVSKALLLSLSSKNIPYFTFPLLNDYNSFDLQDNYKFKGWIHKIGKDNGIDEFDPYAGDINFPPYGLNTFIKDDFKLHTNPHGNNWFTLKGETPSLISEMWSDDKYFYNRETPSKGNKICASIDFLKALCQKYKHNLIIRVEIYRSKKTYNRSKNEDAKFERFFLFTKEGQLRDGEKHYRIRQ